MTYLMAFSMWTSKKPVNRYFVLKDWMKRGEINSSQTWYINVLTTHITANEVPLWEAEVRYPREHCHSVVLAFSVRRRWIRERGSADSEGQKVHPDLADVGIRDLDGVGAVVGRPVWERVAGIGEVGDLLVDLAVAGVSENAAWPKAGGTVFHLLTRH